MTRGKRVTGNLLSRGVEAVAALTGFVLLLIVAGLPLAAQSTVTLGGTPYTLKSHPRTLFDGGGGFLDSRIKDPDGGGPQVAPKAVSSNPAWVALQSSVSYYLPSYQLDSQRYNYRDGGALLQFATYWYADNSQRAAHDAALYMLNHAEYYLPLVCVETQPDCTNGGTGYGLTRYGISAWMEQWMMAYELMRGEMTTAQRQTFADKILNDNAAWGGINGSPSTSCVNPTIDSGQNVTIANPVWGADAGTLAGFQISNRMATITLGAGLTTAGISPGDSIFVAGGAGNFYQSFPVISILGPSQFTIGYFYVNDGNYISAGMTLTDLRSYATVSTPIFGTSINQGDWIFDPNNNVNLGIVTAIVDSTHAFLSGDIQPTAADRLYYRAKEWSPGQCGVIWAVKHDDWNPQPLSYTNGVSAYPPAGGTNGSDAPQNLVYSATFGLEMVFLSIMDDDVNASVRSGFEESTLFDFWSTGNLAFTKQFWTGFHQTGSGYGLTAAPHVPEMSIAITSSLVNPPNVSGDWMKNYMQMFYANTFPDAQGSQMQWGQPGVSGAFGNGMTAADIGGMIVLAYWLRNTTEGQYANWWIWNLWVAGNAQFGNVPGTNLGMTVANINSSSSNASAWFFIFTDQSYPQTNLSSGPTTFPFNASATGSDGQRADGLISRTGYASVTDTLLNFHAEALPLYDHDADTGMPSNFGSYKVFKGHYLLAEDYNIYFADPNVAGFTQGGTASNYIEIGGTQNNVIAWPPVSSAMPRATGNNSYAYGMADVTAVYAQSVQVQHAFRHLVDFKAPGTQQFLVDYMDVKTQQGQTKRAYYHYPNKATTSLTSNVVTSNNPNGVQTQMLTTALAPQPVLLKQDLSGGSFRLDVCPTADGSTCDGTNTQAEMLVVHMPATGWGNSLPPMTMLSSADQNFRGVEIDGASPKVALFARNGNTYTGLTFVTSTPSAAQILIAGITPSAPSGLNYTLVRNGVPVMQHQVVQKDGTIYYQGTAGSYQLVAEQAPPRIRISPLADAGRYQAYLAAFSASQGSQPLTWSINAGALPAGLAINPAAGTITGIPMSAGTFSFGVEVTDALGNTDLETFNLTVDPAAPLQILTPGLTAKVDVPWAGSLSASGGGGAYTWSILSGTLPAGLSLDPTGVISGQTATEEAASVTVEVTDAYGDTAQQQVAVTVIAVPVTSISGLAFTGSTVFQ
jgi:hypothetical protein